MNILILHGIEGYAGIHWQKWLQEELLSDGHEVIMPNLPNSNHPSRSEWLDTANKLMENCILKDTVIVGHSLGVVTALDVIENISSPVKALISVSGFSKDLGSELNSYFMKSKTIDFSKVRRNIGKSFILYGDNDPYVPTEALRGLAEELNVEPKVYKNGGHLNTDSGYTTFPDILKIIKEL